MHYDIWSKLDGTIARLQAIADGAFLDDSSYCDYADAPIQQIKANAILIGLKQELESISDGGERMLAEDNAEWAFLDSVRIAVRPSPPAPSNLAGDQSGLLNVDGTLKGLK